MDVRFCESQELRREAQPRAEDSAICVLRAPPGAPGESFSLLTSTYHGCRQSANYVRLARHWDTIRCGEEIERPFSPSPEARTPAMLLPVYSQQEEGDMDVSNSKKDGMTAGPNARREWRPRARLA